MLEGFRVESDPRQDSVSERPKTHLESLKGYSIHGTSSMEKIDSMSQSLLVFADC